MNKFRALYIEEMLAAGWYSSFCLPISHLYSAKIKAFNFFCLLFLYWCNMWPGSSRNDIPRPRNACILNLLKPTGHVMHQQFNIQQLYVLPTLYLYVLYLSENKQRLVPLTA